AQSSAEKLDWVDDLHVLNRREQNLISQWLVTRGLHELVADCQKRIDSFLKRFPRKDGRPRFLQADAGSVLDALEQMEAKFEELKHQADKAMLASTAKVAVAGLIGASWAASQVAAEFLGTAASDVEPWEALLTGKNILWLGIPAAAIVVLLARGIFKGPSDFVSREIAGLVKDITIVNQPLFFTVTEEQAFRLNQALQHLNAWPFEGRAKEVMLKYWTGSDDLRDALEVLSADLLLNYENKALSQEIVIHARALTRKLNQLVQDEQARRVGEAKDLAMLTRKQMEARVSDPKFQTEFADLLGKKTAFAMLKLDTMGTNGQQTIETMVSALEKHFQIFYGPRIYLSGSQLGEFDSSRKTKDFLREKVARYSSGRGVLPLFLVARKGVENPFEKLSAVRAEIQSRLKISDPARNPLHVPADLRNAQQETAFMFRLFNVKVLDDDDIVALVKAGELEREKAQEKEEEAAEEEKGQDEDFLADDVELTLAEEPGNEKTDQAMLGEEKGGIDLNPALYDLQIKRDGNGVPLPLPQQPIETMHIDGFTPILIEMTPVQNLPTLLGLKDMPTDQSGSGDLARHNEMDTLFWEKLFATRETMG
ncbi:MAG TPA: hypothetical protein VLJ10_03480, partial [Candidatus Bathyarchaeia archaeon]|nr:hypothetical protein [Candidatus Bathyarchaeia archaeon]